LKKVIGYGIYTVIAICGLAQFFLLPGLIWNVTFPFVQLFLIVIGFKKKKKNNVIKYSSLLIGLLFLLEIGFSVYSNSNIKSNDLDKEITVMSYNLFFKNKHQDHSISIIKKANPDILIVQELTPNWASQIEKSLGESYKYKLTKSFTGTHGIGIYSKYKISEQAFLENSANKPYAQIVTLNVDGKSIQLINTHLASPAIAIENRDKFFSLFMANYQIRKEQIIKINELAENQNYDCQLLVGDLNTLHSEPIFKRLRLKWVNSNNGLFRWMKFNFPHTSKIIPIVTLDYILGRGKLKFIESKVIEGGSSDHLAIMAKLNI